MKKFINIIPIILFILFFSTACNNDISYAERLKIQERAINRFINENNLKVVEGFPQDGVFEEGVYYKDTQTGIYLNIVDYGDLDNMVTPLTLVFYRFTSGEMLISNTPLYFNAAQPLSFLYGDESSYMHQVSDYTAPMFFLSYACVLPLRFVGKGGVVNLIIPFDYGSYYQTLTYETFFLKEIKYTQFE